MPNLRQIVEEPRFESEKHAIEPNAPLLDAALHGVTWTLARSPEVGQQTISPTVWAIPTHPMLGVPALVIYYCFDDATVRLLSIEVSPPDPFDP